MQFRPTNEMTRLTEQLDVRLTPSDIIYREFGEITYLLIKNNSIQPPGVARIEFIPRELNTRLDEIVQERVRSKEEDAILISPEEVERINKKATDDLQASQFKSVFQDIERNEKLMKHPHSEQEQVDYGTNDGLGSGYDAPVKSNVIMSDDEDEEEEWF